MAQSAEVGKSNDQTDLHLASDPPPPHLSFFGKILHWLHAKKSTFIVLYILLLSEAVRGITIPSQSHYVKSLGGDASFLGLTVGAFSGGRLAMTVLVGVVGGILSYRYIFIGTGVLLVLSNFLYALAGVANSKWLLFVSRIGLGLGAGTLGTVRAYFAEAYDEKSRTSALAVTAAVQYAGFALFPGVGGFVDYICTQAGWHAPIFNENTVPAWFMLILCLISVLMLLWSFHEPAHKKFELRDLIPIYKPWIYKQAGDVKKSIRKVLGLQTSAEVARDERQFDPHAPSSHELTTFHDHHDSHPNELSTSSPSSSSNVIELPPIKIHHRDNGKEDGTLSASSSSSLGPHNNTNGGLVALDSPGSLSSDTDEEKVEYILDEEELDFDAPVRPTVPSNGEASSPSNKKTARIVTMIWISFLLLNFFIRVALGTVEVLGAQLYDGVTAKYVIPPAVEYSPTNGTFYMILGVIGTGITLVFAIFAKKIVDEIPFFLSLVSLFLGSAILIGQLASMTLARFSFAMALIYSVGYPLAQSVVVSMFSKLSASQRSQAVSMSWIGSAGSVGRILGPIAVGAIFESGGAPPTFIFNTCISALILGQAVLTVYYLRKVNAQ